MLALIALFLPSVIMMLLIRFASVKKQGWKTIVLEYVGCTVLLNVLVIGIARIFFGNRGNVIENLNTYPRFALKYICLSAVLAVLIPLVIRLLGSVYRSLSRLPAEEYLDGTQMTEKLRGRIIRIGFLACFAILVGLGIYQYFRYAVYEEFDLSDVEIADSSQYSWNIEMIDEKSDIYEIEGWIIRNGEDIESRYIQLILVNGDGSAYLVPTELAERTDVTAVMNEGETEYDYDNSGFVTMINKWFVRSGQCRIYILYRNNGRYEIIDTGVTF